MRRLLPLLICLVFASGCGGNDDDGRAAPPPTATPRAEATTTGAQAELQDEAQVETVAEGLEAPWEIAFMPDGRALVTERPGRVRLLGADGRLADEPVAEVDVAEIGEGGLLGLALDPDFAENSLVYLYRTTQDGNQVVRYRFEDGALANETVVVQGIQAASIHDGGRLRLGPDRRLYFSSGDAAQDTLAQDPDSLNGKILRLDLDDAREGADVRPEVFSLGHRNPQGFDWQPGTDRFVEDEHGPDGDDEINILRQGANYGWPEIRGEEQRDGLVSPINVYPDSIAPSGATFVRREGTAWTGDYLMASLVGQRLQRLRLDGNEVVADEALFEGEFGRLRTVVEGPDGALYVLTNNTDGRGSPREGDDRILRIVPPRA